MPADRCLLKLEHQGSCISRVSATIQQVIKLNSEAGRSQRWRVGQNFGVSFEGFELLKHISSTQPFGEFVLGSKMLRAWLQVSDRKRSVAMYLRMNKNLGEA